MITTGVSSRSQPARSDAFVCFGATGDLAFKQIFPALAGLIRDSGWTMPIIGVARHGDVAALRDRAAQSLEAQGITGAAVRHRLQRQLRFINGSDDDPDTFRRLRAELGTAQYPLHYLAIPPALFGEVVRLLGDSHCADGARVIVEKPFGRNLAGARALRLSRSILKANNRRGTFDNLGDTEEGLAEILEASFEHVELETVGSMAIFAATHPRTKPSTDSTP